MFLIQSCIACCAARSASSCVAIGIDVLLFAFGFLDLTGIAVAHDISFSLGSNSFVTGDGADYGGTRWISSLHHSLILEIIGTIAASDDMERGCNG